MVIAEAMADLEERSPRPLYLIAGMLNTKDPVGFFRPFSGLIRRVYTVPVPSSTAGRDPAELASVGRERRTSRRACRAVSTTPSTRIAAEVQTMGPPRILICGSLYLAGAVLAENGTPPREIVLRDDGCTVVYMVRGSPLRGSHLTSNHAPPEPHHLGRPDRRTASVWPA